MSPLYFAYGSNLDAEQMTERCPGSRPLGPAVLRGHRLDFTHFSKRWSGGAADIVPDPGAEVWGVLYELDTRNWARLDPFEAGYDRVELRVEVQGKPLEVLSYSVRRKSRVRPGAVYLDKMLRWGAHWGFPAAYLDSLRALRP